MKRQIIIGLGLFLLILFATGIGAISLLNQLTRTQGQAYREILNKTQALQTLRFETSSINTYYIPDMLMSSGNGLAPIKSAELFNESKERMDEAFNSIKLKNTNIPDPQGEVLEDALDSFYGSYEELFFEIPDSKEDRILALNEISDATQKVSNISQGLAVALQTDLEATTDANDRKRTRGIYSILAFLSFGILFSVMLYFSAGRYLVNPIVDLTNSIHEIQKGNFELQLPTRGAKSELSRLIPAFNTMAAELRARRRATDNQLIKADLLNRAILGSFPHPIILLDEKGQTIKVNPEAESLMDEIGNFSNLPDKIRKKVKQAISEEKDYLPEQLDESILIRRDDVELFYLPRIFRLALPNGTQEGWVLLLTDVSRLRFIDDLKSNLISTVSHEIKTPLTGIRMMLHLLLEDQTGELNPAQKEMVTAAHGDCEKLLKTLRNLLEMSRIDSGASSLNLTPTQPSEIFRESLSFFEGLAAKKGIQFSENFAEDLPEVSVDKVRISEVVNNLISNALKHSPENGTVTLSIAEKGTQFVRFKVSDKGPGVPEESRARIFERFYRAPGQATVEGIGLGLSISREIITAHDGRIGLQSGNPGETEFYFDLPTVT